MAKRRESPLGEFLASSKGLTTVLVLAAASMFPTWVVDRSRPSVPPLAFDPIGESESGQAVRARLWQDPLAAAYGDAAARSKEAERLDEERRSRRRDLHRLLFEGLAKESGRTLLLPVVVAGGSNPHERENRLRYRQAVVSALGAANFYPEDGQRIGYVYPSLTWDGGAASDDPEYLEGRSTPVPFEFFRSTAVDRPNWTRVLVLWIDGDVLRLRPAEKLLAIPNGILAGAHENPLEPCEHVGRVTTSASQGGPTVSRAATSSFVTCSLTEKIDLRYLWTAGSTSLISFLTDWSRIARASTNAETRTAFYWAARDVNGEAPFEVYACTASVPHEEIDRRVKRYEESSVDSVRRCEAGPPITGLDELPGVIDWGEPRRPWCREFYELRMSADGSSAPSILGRIVRTIGDDLHLVESLESELENRCDELGKIALVAEWDTDYGRAWKDNFDSVFGAEFDVESISYLSGIDGRLPGDSGDSKGQSDPSAPEAYQAFGTERTDYVGRLVQRLRNTGAKAPDAIGVLGSDVHDKLLLLSVLRRVYPSAIFFTTDLDARFLDPRGYEYLRNLVIVSQYGLDLIDELQGDIPPFRSGYQAAVFHATLSALEDPVARAHGPVRPRVYEIGREGLVDLSPLEDASLKLEPTRSYVRQPIREALGGGRFKFLALGLALVMLLVSSVFRGAVPTLQMRRTVRAQWLRTGIAFLLLMAVFWVVYFKQSLGDFREPFALLDGVSSWPTEAIRLFAASLAIGWQFRVLRELKNHLPNVEAELGIRRGAASTQEASDDPEFSSAFDVPSPARPGPAESTDIRLGAVRKKGDEPATWFGQTTTLSWTGMPWARPNQRTRRLVDVFDDFRILAKEKYCRRRAVVHLALFVLTAVCLMRAYGSPSKPIRGDIARSFDFFVISTSVLSMQWLIFLVLDAGMISARFIQRLGSENIVDRERETYKRTPRQQLLKDEIVLARRCVDATASLTHRVGKFVYYPSTVILLMIVSRLPVFDAWVWEPHLIAIVLFTIVILIVCYLMLWAAARQLRRQVIDSLTREHGAAFGDEETRQAIDEYIQEIKGLNKGAFAPLWEHPLLRAILIPFAGMGSISILQLLG